MGVSCSSFPAERYGRIAMVCRGVLSDLSLSVWDVGRGQRLGALTVPAEFFGVTDMVLLEDRRLCCAGDFGLAIWEWSRPFAANGRTIMVGELPRLADVVAPFARQIVLRSDGQMITRYPDQIVVYQLPCKTKRGHEFEVMSTPPSPMNARGGNGVDSRVGSRRPSLSAAPGTPTSTGTSAAIAAVATSSAKAAAATRLTRRMTIRLPASHDDDPSPREYLYAFVNAHHIVVSTDEGFGVSTVRIWRISDAYKIATCDNRCESRIRILCGLPTGDRIAAGFEGGQVVIWSASSGRHMCSLLPPAGGNEGESVCCMLMPCDGALAHLLVTGSADLRTRIGVLRVWDLSTCKCLLELEGLNDYRSLAVLSDGRLAVAAGKYVQIWRFEVKRTATGIASLRAKCEQTQSEDGEGIECVVALPPADDEVAALRDELYYNTTGLVLPKDLLHIVIAYVYAPPTRRNPLATAASVSAA